MRKWREKLGFVLLPAAFLFAGSEAQADDCDPCTYWCEPSTWDFCNMHFEAGGDYLYWKPCVDDLDYAAEVDGSASSERVDFESVCPSWESGYRAYLKLDDFYCGFDLYASYTHINSSDSSHVRFDGVPSEVVGITSSLFHPDLNATDFLFQRAHADWNLKYNAWDLLASYDLCCSGCQKLRPYFGFAGIFLDQDLKVAFKGNPESSETWRVKWKSEYWGIGLKAGSEYAFRFYDCLSFFLFGNGTLLVGEPDTENKQRFIDRIKIEDDNCCLLVPGYHLGLGFVYDACICNYEFAFRLGYEYLAWFNLPNPRVFAGDADGTALFSHSASPTTRTLGFHGLFAGLSFKF